MAVTKTSPAPSVGKWGSQDHGDMWVTVTRGAQLLVLTFPGMLLH